MSIRGARQPLLGRGSWPETARIADVLRKETVGASLLLAAARCCGCRTGVGELPMVGRVFLAARCPARPAVPVAAAVGGVLVHASGVHATVAGVLLGFAVPVMRRSAGTGPGLAEHFEHRCRPLSASVAVPVFAFFAAGVTVGGVRGLSSALRDPVAVGVLVGLVVGKPVGVLAATWLVARFTRAELDADLSWWDVLGLALLAGVGFTVSLLIGELAFGAGSDRDDHVEVAVLAGTITAAALAAVMLRARSNVYERVLAAEAIDADHDGTPDVYE